MKVILRIRPGITTKTIDIPDRLVQSEYKIPLYPKMKSQVFNNADVQALITPESTQSKALIFRWDGESKWSGKIPILDLEDYY